MKQAHMLGNKDECEQIDQSSTYQSKSNQIEDEPEDEVCNC